MLKKFDEWSGEKCVIHESSTGPFYHDREIWWCALGVNIGSEQDGTGECFDRPVLILKGFNKQSLLCVALTGKRKEGIFYFYIGKVDDRDATVILSQLRLIDSRRLIRKVATLNQGMFIGLQEKIKKLLFS